MMVMTTYDSGRFSPPAPLASVTLRDPDNGSSVQDVPMLIDTGADVTLLPRSSVNQLGILPIEDTGYEIMGFDGTVSMADVVRLDLQVLGRTFKGRYLIIDQEWGLIGRDILNYLKLVFDGPQQKWGEL
jgi:predicted aspartyl protease